MVSSTTKVIFATILCVTVSSAQDPTHDESWRMCNEKYPATDIFDAKDISTCSSTAKSFISCVFEARQMVVDNKINAEKTVNFANAWIPQSKEEIKGKQKYEEEVQKCISSSQTEEQRDTAMKLWICGLTAFRNYIEPHLQNKE